MTRRRGSKRSGDSEIVVTPDAEQVEQPEVEVETPIDDALVLKVDHTHAGEKYEAGTLVQNMNPSDSSLEFMKANGII